MDNEFMAELMANPYEINGSRIITFSDMAKVLGQNRASMVQTFRRNIGCFTQNADFFHLSSEQSVDIVGIKAPVGCYALTESGFMIFSKKANIRNAVGKEMIKKYFRSESTIENVITPPIQTAETGAPVIRFSDIETVLIQFKELRTLVSVLCDNAIKEDEMTMALHTIETVLNVKVEEFDKLVYSNT